ncbi:Proline/betaine transporter [Microbacterium oxydans]|uniref:Proline/betaine transporter n=1 Tax=Microbacterium oxydans TaxID=82380 RepID=A0A0F0LBU5_9MICO|nr:MFS transporter [Microbacterium oxydans]KJL30628.1 Proline/betaine transporter [Microbacterium oxydans]CAH0207259.1 Proline/betaine transporter [Microbacterium oxydans]
MTNTAIPRKTPAKAAIASWVGTTLEYYDFAVYGTASALVLNQLFFPPELPEGVRVLLSLATFAVGYVVRPLGAFILGPLGDRFGRKFVMMLTLFGIGICTFIIGCLPTYEQIGIAAPVLLVVIRILQGLSVSGEQASAITMSLEHAPERRRAFTTSFTTSGSASGGLLATAVFIPFAALPTEDLLGWAWRIPFWLSAVVVVVAYLIRRNLEEPPSFLETQAIKVQLAPMKQATRFHWVAIIRVAACAIIAGVSYLFATFSVAFATTGYGLDKATMLWVPVLASLLALLYTPLAGFVADIIGRKTVFIIGAIGAGVTLAPYLWAITQGDWPLIFVLGILCNGLFYSTANAAWPAFFAEMFPNRVRVSGLAVGTQIGFAIAGAVGPVASTALAGADLKNWFGPAMLGLGLMLIAVISALTAKDTSRYTLDEVDDVQQTQKEKDTVTASILIP